MSLSKTAIRKWLDATTPAQARAMAKAAKTSVPHLRHIAAGRRDVSAELAQRLATASYTLHVADLRLDPRDLCDTCRRCPLVVGRSAPAPYTMLKKPKAAKAAPKAQAA